MDKAQQELIRGYLAKARGKSAVARELLANGHWDDTIVLQVETYVQRLLS